MMSNKKDEKISVIVNSSSSDSDIRTINTDPNDHSVVATKWSDLDGATNSIVKIFFYKKNDSDTEGAIEIVDKSTNYPLVTINVNENTTNLNSISTVTSILEAYGLILTVRFAD